MIDLLEPSAGLTDHVIVYEGASYLNESSNCKCHIFNRSLVIWAAKLCKPLKQRKL